MASLKDDDAALLLIYGYIRLKYAEVYVPTEIVLVFAEFLGMVIEVALSYHSHRKHSRLYHPRNVLINDNTCYASAMDTDFSHDECDWLIFELNELCVPKKLRLKNWSSSAGIQQMLVFIGNVDTNTWIQFEPEYIYCRKSYKIQEIKLNATNEEIIKNNKFKFIRIVLMSNHGDSNTCHASKYRFYYLALFGVKYKGPRNLKGTNN